jgi:hypothetical protein
MSIPFSLIVAVLEVEQVRGQVRVLTGEVAVLRAGLGHHFAHRRVGAVVVHGSAGGRRNPRVAQPVRMAVPGQAARVVDRHRRRAAARMPWPASARPIARSPSQLTPVRAVNDVGVVFMSSSARSNPRGGRHVAASATVSVREPSDLKCPKPSELGRIRLWRPTVVTLADDGFW